MQTSILVSDLAFEVFILVGAKARHQRREIYIALQVAEVGPVGLITDRIENILYFQSLSKHTASDRPFEPPVHVLIFPSRIPLDLSAAIRGFDELKIVRTVRFTSTLLFVLIVCDFSMMETFLII